MSGLYQWRHPIFWTWPKDDRYERRPDGSLRLKAPYRVEKMARSTRRLRRQRRALKGKPGATIPAHPVSRGAMQRWKRRLANGEAA